MESWIAVPGSEGALKRMGCPALERLGQTVTVGSVEVELAVGVETAACGTGVKVGVGVGTTI